MSWISKATLILLLCVAYASCRSLPLKKSSRSFELSIIHFSDFHARFLPVSASGGLCYENEKCVGGIARVASIVRHLKQIRPNAIFLNAGDCFQGTLYYDVHRGNITAHFMNELPHDAITIGNHDFDDDISGLASFVRQLNAPVVLANIDHSEEPSLQDIYTNSTVIRKDGKDIGIIGVTFTSADKISSHTGKVKFLNEIETINAEAKKLKSKGVNIIIVLSHCGIESDKIIARICPDVDVIVGGHSHILLYDGKAPSNDIPYDKYPMVVSQKDDNRKVLIVHASAFTKYMGDIRIIFDKNDEVVHWEGNPIYLDASVEEDPSIVEELQPWSVDVDKIGKRVVGETEVFLNKDACSIGECTFANLITDSMVDLYAANTTIGMTFAFIIKNSIPIGPILYEDLYTTLSFNNTWDLIDLQGKDLLQALEDNVSNNQDTSSFINHESLHWSGLRVIYNLSNPVSKLVSAKARCFECEDEFEDIDANKWYRIAVSTYLVTTGFSKIIQENHRNYVRGLTSDLENLVNYVEKIKTVNVKPDGRMIFV